MSIFTELRVSDDASGAYDMFAKFEDYTKVCKLVIPDLTTWDINKFVINMSMSIEPASTVRTLLDRVCKSVSEKDSIVVYTSWKELSDWLGNNSRERISSLSEMIESEKEPDEFGIKEMILNRCKETNLDIENNRYNRDLVNCIAEFYSCLKLTCGVDLKVTSSLDKYLDYKCVTPEVFIKRNELSEESVFTVLSGNPKSKQTPEELAALRKAMVDFEVHDPVFSRFTKFSV